MFDAQGMVRQAMLGMQNKLRFGRIHALLPGLRYA